MACARFEARDTSDCACDAMPFADDAAWPTPPVASFTTSVAFEDSSFVRSLTSCESFLTESMIASIWQLKPPLATAATQLQKSLQQSAFAAGAARIAAARVIATVVRRRMGPSLRGE